MQNPTRHQCLIYEGPPSRHLPALVAVMKQKLQENHRCLYFDSPPMLAGLRSFLAAGDVDVLAELGKGSLVLSSDQGHLVAGKFDVDRMIETLKSAVQQALQDGYSGLWATGDMTWEFGPKRDFSKLVEYEWKLEDFIRQNSALGGICLYHSDTLPRDAMRQGLATHHSLFVNETLSRINPHFIPPDLFNEESASGPEFDSALDEVCRYDSKTENRPTSAIGPGSSPGSSFPPPEA